MAINDRIIKYFVETGDLEIPGERVPMKSSENQLTSLVDGAEYFHAIRQEVDAFKGPGTGNRFFYFTDWVLMLTDFNASPTVGGLPSAWQEKVGTTAFHLDDSSGAVFPLFLDELAAMAANNIDVCALVWVSPYVLSIKQVAEKELRYNNYAASMLSVKALREKPSMAHKACLNLVAHPVGAVHMKMVVCGDDTKARAYITGIDFQIGRVDSRNHPRGNLIDPKSGRGWHDVGVKVEGPAVDTAYSYFRSLWNEQIARKVETFRFGDDVISSHDKDTPEVPDRTFLPVPNGPHHVQVLRTAPQMNFSFGETAAIPANCLFRLIAGFRRPALSFAPEGIFEFRVALKKAIAAAEEYIYVEDQAFTGREIMGWIHDRLIATPNLKVIFVLGFDPTDPPTGRILLNMAVNQNLAPGVPNISDRVAFYVRMDGVVVHSKTWIIDDEYVIIGSANTMRRSLYTDVELSVGVLDENEGSGSFAVTYRSSLWAEHCGILSVAGRAPFENLADAIKIWDANWSIGGAAGAPPGVIKPFLARRRVPFSKGPAPDQFPDDIVIPATPEEREKINIEYDINDGDSRQEY